MSFFFDTLDVPFWFIVLIFASAAPLWLKWSKKFHEKFIVTGLLAKRFNKVKAAAETKILTSAKNHWADGSDIPNFTDRVVAKKKKPKKDIDPVKKQNIQTVLKILAEAGEAGILAKSIADMSSVPTLDTTNALAYLRDKKYAEQVNSTNGTKYYLTDLGRRYCINKKFL